ncbi:hypothetical protein FJZ48_00840 [Candidatus Uhrbacteria bacterium]|nr:hypothetical protein [Candidatus Uhrbacteria bacterium]
MSFVVASLLAVVSCLVSRPVRAETVAEILKRQEQHARVDREKIPLYAVSVETLMSGRSLPGMPPELLKRAREGHTDAKVGESLVSIKRRGGFVRFSIRAQAVFNDGWSMVLGEVDPIEEILNRMYIVQSWGVVFAKVGKGKTPYLPHEKSCGALYFVRQGEDPDVARKVCERFHLSGGYGFTEEEAYFAGLNTFLISLIANHGTQGVVARATIEKVMNDRIARIQKVIEGVKENSGYITYNFSTDVYEVKQGHLVGVTAYSEYGMGVKPGGNLKIFVDLYTRDVSALELELVYADGAGLQQTALGNMSKVSLTRAHFYDSSDGVSAHHKAQIALPMNLKPGKIVVMASAVDREGKLLMRQVKVGSIEYAKADPDPKKK